MSDGGDISRLIGDLGADLRLVVRHLGVRDVSSGNGPAALVARKWHYASPVASDEPLDASELPPATAALVVGLMFAACARETLAPYVR